MRGLILTLAACVGLIAAPPGRAETIEVFAAASLADVLSDAAAGWSGETGHKVTVVATASSTLARQVAAGAGADIVIPASTDWIDWMEAHGLLASETRRALMANSLVLVAHGAGMDLSGPIRAEDLVLPAGGRLAVALTEAVPAGQYARSGLQTLGLWDAVADRLAETDNVRAALTLVAVGAAPLGVVYATDAAADPRVHIRAHFPENSHPAILYSGAVTAGADSPEAALAFLDWLGGPAGRAILAQHGFVALPE